MKKVTLLPIIMLLIFGATGFWNQASAKSINWNKTDNAGTYYYLSGWFGYQPYGISPNTAGRSWVKALENPNYTITYTADVYNESNGGTLVSDGDSIPVGTQLRFAPKQCSSSDISWFGTGFSGDSPNGDCVENAVASHRSPNEINEGNNGSGVNIARMACRAKDYVGGVPANTGGNWNIYIPFSVNPASASINHTGSASLSCNGDKTLCTVNSPGTLNSTFTFSATYGKLYYRYSSTQAYRMNNPNATQGRCSMNPNLIRDGEGGDEPCYFNVAANSCFGDNTPLSKNNSTGEPFVLNIPQQSIPYTLTVPGKTNQPPNPPTITGPTSAEAGTYQFTFTGTDPDGDQVKYYIDWDNNGSIDEGNPYDAPVNSGQTVNMQHAWTTPGTYTFKALTQDINGANSGWSSYSITITAPPATPIVNLQINNSDGPLSVPQGSTLTLTWTSTNATTCTAYGAGWSAGSPVAINGTQSVTANQGDNYILSCTGPGGTTNDQVVVALQNSLKVCQNSCSSGVLRGDTNSTRSFTLTQGGTQNLVSCFNPSSSCNDGSGDVTGSTTWGEAGSNVVSLSGTNPKTVTGNSAGSENISASYSGQTANMNASVTCIPTVACGNTPGAENYCENQTFNVDNGCGVSISCNGTKTCNYNWKEVAP